MPKCPLQVPKRPGAENQQVPKRPDSVET